MSTPEIHIRPAIESDLLMIRACKMAVPDPTAFDNQFPGCSPLGADVNGNRVVNGKDIATRAGL